MMNVALGFFAVAAALVVSSGVAQAQQGEQMPPPAVIVERIEAQEIVDPTRFSGRVEAIEAVDIRGRVQGFLQSVEFNGGEAVEAGELLFTIEPALYETSLAAAQAQLAGAQATLREAERGLARNQELAERGAVAEAALDEAVAASETAEASVQVAEVAVRQAELELSYTRIASPIDGQIGRPLFNEGSLVGLDVGALARVVQLDPIRVVFSVTEGELVGLRQASSNGGPGINRDQLLLYLELPNGATYEQQGAFDFVAAEVDPSTGTVAVRAIFPNPDALLIPNQYVTLFAREAEEQIQPVVPQSAILQDREGRFVYVLEDDNTVRQQRVETGARVADGWEVTQGLEAGDSVVVQGVQRLTDGTLVQASEGQPLTGEIAAPAEPARDDGDGGAAATGGETR